MFLVWAFVVALIGAASVGCGTAPVTTAPAQADAPETTPVAAPPSAAAARADALLADMAKREAEYKKAEADIAKQERSKPLPVIEAPAPVSAAASASPVLSPQAAATPSPAGSIAVQFGGHDEAWWKNEMRNAEVRATDDARRLQEAIDTQTRARDQMGAATKAGAVVFAQAQEAFNRATAEVQRLQGEVRNDNAAVERVREDARRANVPPGWLRWP